MMFELERIKHIRGLDHPESIGVAPDGTLYTTGTGCQIYHVDPFSGDVRQVGRTDGRVLGSAVDADGVVYLANTTGNVLRMTQDGVIDNYATAPGGGKFMCANYLAFDRQGNLYLSDSGTWAPEPDGILYRIPPGGGEATLWCQQRVNAPNAIALDAAEEYLYFVETFAGNISRVEICQDGSAGRIERVVELPRHVPDGIAFDFNGRLWIACHRPDSVYVYDLEKAALDLFCSDWAGHRLRGPTDIAFAGVDRNIMLAASLDNLVIHHFENAGVRGRRSTIRKSASLAGSLFGVSRDERPDVKITESNATSCP